MKRNDLYYERVYPTFLIAILVAMPLLMAGCVEEPSPTPLAPPTSHSTTAPATKGILMTTPDDSNADSPTTQPDTTGFPDPNDKVELTPEQWREQLTADEFRVLREQGTEPAFRNEYHGHKADGHYICAGCNNVLFASDTKYNSGTGWPSFYQPVTPEAVDTESDTAHGMVRTFG